MTYCVWVSVTWAHEQNVSFFLCWFSSQGPRMLHMDFLCLLCNECMQHDRILANRTFWTMYGKYFLINKEIFTKVPLSSWSGTAVPTRGTQTGGSLLVFKVGHTTSTLGTEEQLSDTRQSTCTPLAVPALFFSSHDTGHNFTCQLSGLWWPPALMFTLEKMQNCFSF